MTKPALSIIVIGALVWLAAPIAAPAAAVSDPQIPDLVQGLVVAAAIPGPAWWKVSNGTAIVWILGVPPYISSSLRWDKAPLERRLKGAQVFLPPPYLELQPVVHNTKTPLPVNYDGMAEPGQTVADLPAELRDRLNNDLLRYRQPVALGKNSIIYATRNLVQGMFNRAPLGKTAMQSALNAEVRAAHVPMEQVDLNTISTTEAYQKGPVEPKITCLKATLDVAESSDNPFAASIEAWAQGDVPNALAVVGCVGVKGQVYRDEVNPTVAKIEAYLETPGKAVAAVELIPLLMRDGVVERLNAAGYMVQGPEVEAGE